MIALRRATVADVAAIATLDHTTRHQAMPNVAWKHPLHEVVAYVGDHMLPAGGLVVAEAGGTLIGYMDAHGGWVHQLYVSQSHWRTGIGSLLLSRAQADTPAGLQLWCFQVNARARAFYERHGFTIARMTDGADNEEREPDILYAWQPEGAAP